MTLDLQLIHKLLILAIFFVAIIFWRSNHKGTNYKEVLMACLALCLVYFMAIIVPHYLGEYIVQTIVLVVVLWASYDYYNEGLLRRRTQLRDIVYNPTSLHKEIETKIILPELKNIEKKNIELDKKLAKIRAIKDDLFSKVERFKEEKLHFHARKKDLQKEKTELLKLELQLNKERKRLEKLKITQ